MSELTKRVYNALGDGLPQTAPDYYWRRLSFLQEWGLRWPHEHGHYGRDLVDRIKYAEYWIRDYHEMEPEERSLGTSGIPGVYSALHSAAKATGYYTRGSCSFIEPCKHNAMRFLIWTLHEMESRPEDWGIREDAQTNLFERPSLLRHEKLRLWMAGGDVAEKLDRFTHQRCQHAIGNREDPPDVVLRQSEVEWALNTEYRLTRTQPFWEERTP